MDIKSEHALKSKISHINQEIKRKQLLLQKWGISLARKREQMRAKNGNTGDTNSTIDSVSDSNCNDYNVNDTVIIKEVNKNLEALQIEIPHSSNAYHESSPTLQNPSSGLLMLSTRESNVKRFSRAKKNLNVEHNLKKSKNERRRQIKLTVSFPPFPILLKDIDEAFCLPTLEFPSIETSTNKSVTDISTENQPSNCESSSLLEDDSDYNISLNTISVTTPTWKLKSDIEGAIEIIRLWTYDQIMTLVTCQRNRITVWIKTTTENVWKVHKLVPLKINKGDVYRFDIFRVKDVIGVLVALKYDTSVRISLFSFPHYLNTEKITTVSELTYQILCCQCDGNLIAYGFTDDFSTTIEIWRTDSNLNRLIRGRAVASIEQPIHSLCSLINTKGQFFVGIAFDALYVWNAVLGSLVITVSLGNKFNSVKHCSFATLEKSFLFLGVVNVAEKTEGQLLVINPKTAKWKSIFSWKECCDGNMFLCDDFPTADLISILSKRCICLRDMQGSLVARASLSQATSITLSAIHLSHPSNTEMHTLAVGNTVGNVAVYNLNV